VLSAEVSDKQNCRNGAADSVLSTPYSVTSTPYLFPARVNIEKHGDDNQHQGFHEEEEARDKGAVFIVSVLVGDERAESNARYQPNKLAFSIPHNHNFTSSRLVFFELALTD